MSRIVGEGRRTHCACNHDRYGWRARPPILTNLARLLPLGIRNVRAQDPALLWSHWNGLLRRTRAANWFDFEAMQAHVHRGGDAVSLAPSAEEILASSRLAGADFPAGLRVTEPSLDETLPRIKPINGHLLHDQPSLGRRALRRISRFLLTVCMGVAATLAWQSYGDAAKQIVADWAAQRGWSSWLPLVGLPSVLDVTSRQARPPTPTMEPSTPETVAATPGAPLSSMPQLEAMAQNFAAIRQSVEELAAGQRQLAQDMVKLQSAVQEIQQKTFAPPPKPNTASEHKPQATSPGARQPAAPVRPTTPDPPSRALAPAR